MRAIIAQLPPDCSGGAGSPRETHSNRGAVRRARLDVDAATYEPHALVDAAQPQAGPRALAGREADAVVGDDQLDRIAGGDQLDADRARAGVPDGIGQRFLRRRGRGTTPLPG